MHGFGLSFGLWWWILPVAVVFFAAPVIRRLIQQRTGSSRIEGGQPPSLSMSSEARLFRLAKRLDGRLTVSDVVVETGLNPPAAESLLQGLVDGIRVDMEVDPNGTVFYEFKELRGDRS